MEDRVGGGRRLKTLGLDLGLTQPPRSTGARHDGELGQSRRLRGTPTQGLEFRIKRELQPRQQRPCVPSSNYCGIAGCKSVDGYGSGHAARRSAAQFGSKGLTTRPPTAI